MRYLLDTHALIWFATGDGQLSKTAKNLIIGQVDDVMFSMASVWELAIKSSIGKLDSTVSPQAIYKHFIDAEFKMVWIMPEHAMVVERLPMHHRDPFDRMLIAQAVVDEFALITRDEQFEPYDIECVW